jgi:hypothetical protein
MKGEIFSDYYNTLYRIMECSISNSTQSGLKKKRCGVKGCRKKIGFDPIICKGCDTSYCGAHRLSFQHTCDTEKLRGFHKNMIEKQNPIVKKDKIANRI